METFRLEECFGFDYQGPHLHLRLFRAVHEKMNVSRWQDPAYEKLLDQVTMKLILTKERST